MSRGREGRNLAILTIAAALLLTEVPLPPALLPLKPYWVALVVVYWTLELPDGISLGLAFAIGLALDLFSGALMGLHALSLVIMVFLVRHFRSRLRFYPTWQQALALLALLVNDRIVLLWITIFLGEPIPTWKYWLSPLVGAAVWPWLFLLLDHLRVRERQAKA